MKHILERFLRMYPGEVLRTFAQLPGAIVHKDYVYVPGTREDRILLVAHADTVSNCPPDYLKWQGNLLKGGWTYKPSTTSVKASTQTSTTTTTPVSAPAQIPAKVNQHSNLCVCSGCVPHAKECKCVQCLKPAKTDDKTPWAQLKDDAITANAAGPQCADMAGGGEQYMDITDEHSIEGLTQLNDDTPSEADAAVQIATMEEQLAQLRQGAEGMQKVAEQLKPERKSEGAAVQTTSGKLVDSFNKGVEAIKKKGIETAKNFVAHGGWDDDAYDYRYSWRDKCLGADDRAGIAVLWLMRRSGHSLLITDHEETGGRGARMAAMDLADELADHQFAVQIDRRYDQEMVFYDCATDAFEQHMVKATRGYHIGIGSFTDISIICPAAGICGVNLSAGYWNEHTEAEMLSYDAWLRTYNIVYRMCWQESHPRFELPPPPPPEKKVTRYGGFSQADAEWWEKNYSGGFGYESTASSSQKKSVVSIRDEEVVAYQVGQMVLCRKNCDDYVAIAQYDNPRAPLAKLRQQDISEWDTCEGCGLKLYELPDKALEAKATDVQKPGTMIHLFGKSKELVGA
jgi:hypothetical protein